jgi:4-amino-4-deoxy-L-arabinose transferase-like glycosyltransferase
LRFFDAALGGLTLVVGYAVARQVLSAGLAVATSGTLAGIPMFTAVSSALSADPLANLLAALVVLLLVARLRSANRSTDVRWALATGVVIGLGVLTKLAVGIFVPLMLVVIAMRSRLVVRESVSSLGVAAIVVAPWLAHQVTTYGWTDPLALARHSAVVADQPRFPGLNAAYASDFATTTFHSFWAQFGWMAIVAPSRLYWIWGVLTAVAAIGLILERRRLAAPVWQLLVATAIAAFVAYVGYNLTFEQFQGRYLFTAIVPIAALLVAGWTAWVPLRWRAPVALSVSVALAVLNAYALFRVLVPGFAPIT